MHSSEMHGLKSQLVGSENRNALKNLESQVFSDPKAAEPKFRESPDPISMMELGAIYSHMGEFENSNRVLEKVFQIYNAQEERAIISLTQTSTQVGEATLSEGMGEYQLANYEKVLLHAIKAMNHLLLGNPEGARVEISRAYIRQSLIKQYSDLEAARAQANLEDETQKAANNLGQTYSNSFAPDNLIKEANLNTEELATIQHVRRSYENAYIEVLSSIIYNLNSELDNSLPPLRRAVEITGNPFVSAQLSQLEHLQNGSPVENSNLSVFIHEGYAPEKVSFPIIFPNPITGAINKISLAKYVPQPSPVARAVLLDSRGREIGDIAELDLIDALAFKDYEEKLPARIAKALSRLIVQSIKDYILRDQMGSMGTLMGSMMNLIVENADTRTWTLLPKRIRYFSGRVSDSQVHISLRNQQGTEIFGYDIPVPRDTATLVSVRALGDKTFLQYIAY